MSDTQQRGYPEPLTKELKRAFRDQMPVPLGVEPQLAAALRDVLERPGSLVRAKLAFQMAFAFGLGEGAAEYLAISLEYFHTASLLFDDLPSMDDATRRRGAVCLHHVYGESTAILCSLALINRAYALFWKATGGQSPQERGLASAFLETFLGLRGLIDGQSRDLHFADNGTIGQAAQEVALEKTASLIRLPLVLPAILGGATEVEQALLNRLASVWGLGYQALDDLADLLRDQHETGKTTGRDQHLGRPNVALELGSEATIARVQRLARIAEQIQTRLRRLRPSLGFLEEVSARLRAEAHSVLQDAAGATCCS